MQRRRWRPEQEALIVPEGLKGRPIGELCAEHEISQGQHYEWRDQCLANAGKAFEPAGAPQRQGRLERENARLQVLVGELTLEIKTRGDPGVKRGPAPRVAARNAGLLERIRELKAEHSLTAGTGLGPIPQPGGQWGDRRIRAHLRYVDGLVVNQKRIYGTTVQGRRYVPGQRERRKGLIGADEVRRDEFDKAQSAGSMPDAVTLFEPTRCATAVERHRGA